MAESAKFGRIVIRVTDDEKQFLDSAAAIVGKPTSTWARDELFRLAETLFAEGEKQARQKKFPTSRKK